MITIVIDLSKRERDEDSEGTRVEHFSLHTTVKTSSLLSPIVGGGGMLRDSEPPRCQFNRRPSPYHTIDLLPFFRRHFVRREEKKHPIRRGNNYNETFVGQPRQRKRCLQEILSTHLRIFLLLYYRTLMTIGQVIISAQNLFGWKSIIASPASSPPPPSWF